MLETITTGWRVVKLSNGKVQEVENKKARHCRASLLQQLLRETLNKYGFVVPAKAGTQSIQ